MPEFDYIIEKLDGDYAYLRRIENGKPVMSEELKCVARALLPDEIAEGVRLHYAMLSYTVI